MRHHGPVISLSLCLLIGLCAAGADAAPAKLAAERTAAIFTYRNENGTLRHVGTFSGVVLSPTRIVTSARAVRSGGGALFGAGAPREPDRIVALVRVDGQTLVVDCDPVLADDDEGIQVLRIVHRHRAAIAERLAGSPRVGSMDEPPVHGVGVFGPSGVTPEALGGSVVPAPYQIDLRLGPAARIEGLELDGFPLQQTLPAQVDGAGVWTDAKLVGMILRREGGWWAIDADALARIAGRTEPDDPTPGIVEPTPTPTPQPPDPIPGVPTTPDVTPDPRPDPTPVAGPPAPQSPEMPAGLARLVRETGGQPVLDPGLADYVKQDQADMAMAFIVGGKPKEALGLVDDILFLARDQFAEQLTYRRALALALMGEHRKAIADAQKMITAKDPQVRGRAQILATALDLAGDGAFDGKPLTDPAALKAAYVAGLQKTHRSLSAKLDAVVQLKAANATAYNGAVERVQTVIEEIDAASYGWPGYFDALGEKAAQAVQNLHATEYKRVHEALRRWRDRYDEAVGNLQVVSGPEFTKPGYWPPDQARAANLAAEEFNAALVHVRKVEASVPGAQRVTLPDALSKPLDTVEAAEKRP